jgi:RNA polymerase sigma factor (sigma-70 family)
MDDLQQCWNSVLADDTDALRLIHESLYSSLHHYAKGMLKDEALADDAIQEIFIKAWTQRHKIGNLQHVKAFFFTMLRRHNLNQLRSIKTRMVHLGLFTSAQNDIEFSPEEIVVYGEYQKEGKARIGQLLNQLPKRQKEVIYLKYYEELEYKDISAIMKINYQSVVNLSFKALQFLKTAIQQGTK